MSGVFVGEVVFEVVADDVFVEFVAAVVVFSGTVVVAKTTSSGF